MFQGISFTIKQDLHINILQSIFKGVGVDNYNWYNILEQNEVLSDTFDKNTFDCDYYDGESFKTEIKKGHYIVFLKLQAYFDKKKFFNIHTCDELIHSDCQILVLIYDSEFVEVYSKDELIIGTVYKNAVLNKFKDIQLISDVHSFRKKMDIL